MPLVPAREQPGRERGSSRTGALQLLRRWGDAGVPGENRDGNAAPGSDGQTLVAADWQTGWPGSSGRATAKAEGDTALRRPPTHAAGGSGGTEGRTWAATIPPEQPAKLERF